MGVRYSLAMISTLLIIIGQPPLYFSEFHHLILLVCSLSCNNDLGIQSVDVLKGFLSKVPNLKNLVW